MRPRLPGLARRRHTFDAFIRRRVTNLISVKKRKNFYARQRSPRPTFRQRFAGSQAREESTRVARKSMNQLQKVAGFIYLPQRTRQLVRRGELANGQASLQAAKRRSTFRLNVGHSQRKALALAKSSRFVLQTALETYCAARRLRDLRKVARRRRVSQAPRFPF